MIAKHFDECDKKANGQLTPALKADLVILSNKCLQGTSLERRPKGKTLCARNRRMMISRLLSLVFAIACVVVAFLLDGAKACLPISLATVIPLLLIFHGRTLGNLASARLMALSSPTPGIIVTVFGWIVLLALFGLLTVSLVV